MNPVAVIDIVFFLGSFAALLALLRGWNRAFDRGVKFLYAGLLVSTLFYSLCLLLEWTEITNALDTIEDYVGAILPMWWAFIFYGFMQESASSDLRKSEERYRALFEKMPSGVAVYEVADSGEDFIFKDFNKAGEGIEHVNKNDIIGRCVTEVFPGVKDFGAFTVFQRVWETGNSEYFPEAVYKDERDPGTWRESWVYKLPSGEIVSVYNDITDRKRAEEALVESEERFRHFEPFLDN